MQLTQFTDYGIRALMYMAILPDDELTNINQITEHFGLSRNHMVKIINKMSQVGFVEAIRGKKGGIRLAQAATEISIGNVIRSLEPLQLVNCSLENCHITNACRLKHALNQAIFAFLAEMDKYSLHDMLNNNVELHQLLIPTKTL